MTADWVDGKADYIPEEFYFLIGVTHRGFPTEEREVINTFGANLSFKREAFLKLGGIKLGGIDPQAYRDGRPSSVPGSVGPTGRGSSIRPMRSSTTRSTSIGQNRDG